MVSHGQCSFPGSYVCEEETVKCICTQSSHFSLWCLENDFHLNLHAIALTQMEPGWGVVFQLYFMDQSQNKERCWRLVGQGKICAGSRSETIFSLIPRWGPRGLHVSQTDWLKANDVAIRTQGGPHGDVPWKAVSWSGHVHISLQFQYLYSSHQLNKSVSGNCFVIERPCEMLLPLIEKESLSLIYGHRKEISFMLLRLKWAFCGAYSRKCRWVLPAVSYIIIR